MAHDEARSSVNGRVRRWPVLSTFPAPGDQARPPDLVGRDRELAAIDRLIDDRRAVAMAVLLDGQARPGTPSLWRARRTRAAQAALRVSAAELGGENGPASSGSRSHRTHRGGDRRRIGRSPSAARWSRTWQPGRGGRSSSRLTMSVARPVSITSSPLPCGARRPAAPSVLTRRTERDEPPRSGSTEARSSAQSVRLRAWAHGSRCAPPVAPGRPADRAWSSSMRWRTATRSTRSRSSRRVRTGRQIGAEASSCWRTGRRPAVGH